MSDKKESFIISGKAYWAKVHTPNEEGKYTIDLSIDDGTKTKLEGLGITVKNAKLGIGVLKVKADDDRGNFVTLKRTHETQDGKTLGPPSVVDGKKNPVPKDVLIGNGSLVNVLTSTFEWKNKQGKKGISLGLNAVQVIALVQYSKSAVDAFSEVDGYAAPAEVKSSVSSDDTFDFSE